MNADAPKKGPEPKQIAEFKTERQITASRFNADGTMLATAGYEPLVRRWQFDGKALTALPPLEGHHGYSTAIAFHPTQPHLYSADSWGQLRCQPVTGDAPKPVWRNDKAHDGWIRQIAVSPDGTRLATCGKDQAVRLWDSATGKLITDHKASDDIYALIFDPSGKALIFGDMHGRLEAWDIATQKTVRTFDASLLYKLDRIQDLGGLRVLMLMDGGKTLVAAGTTPQNGATPQSIPTMLFFDYATGKLTKTLTHGTNKEGYIHDLALHPAGYLMAVTSGTPGSGMMFLLRPDEKEPFHVTTKMANCHTIALHPDGKHFVVSSTNRDSNGNGRRLSKDGAYFTNTSPLHLWEVS